MHSLAIALKKNGHQVTGSDDTIFDPSLTQLQKAEICPEQMGWYPEKINKKPRCSHCGNACQKK